MAEHRSVAVQGGNEEVVGILFERKDLNLSTADRSCQAAASWPEQNLYTRTAKLIRDRADLARRYAASLEPTDSGSPEQSEPSETPSKKICRF